MVVKVCLLFFCLFFFAKTKSFQKLVVKILTNAVCIKVKKK